MGPLVMVVEDDDGLRFIYKRVLEPIGVDLIEAEDGAVAIDHLEQHVPDLVILDILLPHVNGLEVLAYIASQPRLKKVNIVVVSANPRFEHEAKEIFPVHFVTKPVRPEQIREFARGSMV